MLVACVMAMPAASAEFEPAREPEPSAVLREEAIRYEHGEGVVKDIDRAVALYCEAARLGDAMAQFNLGWIYAQGRGVSRNDALAAFFLAAAADQGIEQAARLLKAVGAPTLDVPACMAPVVAVIEVPSEPDAAALPSPAMLRIRTTAPKLLLELVEKNAPDFQIEPQLALAIMDAESNFDSLAVSPRSAAGLMQLIPETAARFGVRNVFDPRQNLRGGLAYLRWLLAYFEGDLTLVAAAYNAGEGTVDRYGGVPPFRETRRYVRRIVQAVGSLLHPFDPRVVAPSPRLPFIQGMKREKDRVAAGE